jgi:two-component sensor histidine kinase
VCIIGPKEKQTKENSLFLAPSKTVSDIHIWTVIALLLGTIFIFDIASPTRLVFWTLYFFPLFLTLYVRQRNAHSIVAFIVIVLVLAGIFFGNQNGQVMNMFLNRIFFSAVIGVLAYFIGTYRNSVSELRESREKLSRNEETLRRNEADLTASLKEKEVLLSEIHHRVKNNLTAFISLLDINGSDQETPERAALRLDLQNRARSMALVHETLYRTHNYSDVDMNVYLTTLTGQVVDAYGSQKTIRTLVNAEGISLDLSRATPVGMIINELLTNSLKYAFPEGSPCLSDRENPRTVRVSLSKEAGMYILQVSDNGIGLPPGVIPAETQTLGLKLVNFLARHQLRAKVEVNTVEGTEFVFRFKE